MDAFDAYQARWKAFARHRVFTPFKRGRSDEELQEEFYEISSTRFNLWNEQEYAVSEELFSNDTIRAKNCAAFAYNNTASYYNASTIYLGGKSYVACEGPRKKTVPHFFKLLNFTKTTHLVRLTPAYEGTLEKCYPYWENLCEDTYLCLGETKIRLFIMENWKDNRGVSPQELLDIALQVKKESKNGFLTVHCSAGVGRTGTFLAALAILDATKSPFSIEEIVYRLAVQRKNCVGEAAQYITLYRLAETIL